MHFASRGCLVNSLARPFVCIDNAGESIKAFGPIPDETIQHREQTLQIADPWRDALKIHLHSVVLSICAGKSEIGDHPEVWKFVAVLLPGVRRPGRAVLAVAGFLF